MDYNLLIYDPNSPLLFNSAGFLMLFLAFYFVYVWIRDNATMRVIYLIAFSMFFYYKSSGVYVGVLVGSAMINYVIGEFMFVEKEKKNRVFTLVLSLIFNLGLLVYFKYTNLLIDTYNNLTGGHIQLAEIFLPAGISFFTFQALSYSIDIYRGKLEPAKTPLDFLFFLSFFPHLVAGPIVKASDFIPQIRQKLTLDDNVMTEAFMLIIGGLIKKAVISDYISVNFVDRIFDNPTLYSPFENLAAVYGYALQIYCDFSGYSDMAIGLALLMGYRLMNNFDAPYQSASLTEFWRRWHISLSSWLRDYLYVSMGGNRKGKIRTYINLMVTMLLGGLWHGPSWKFVAWGGLHGGMLAVERFIKNNLSIPNTFIIRVLGILFTFHFVCFCWIFFRADSFEMAWQVVQQITHGINLSNAQEVVRAYQPVFGLFLFGYLLHWIPQSAERFFASVFTSIPLIFKSLVLALVIWVVIQVSSAEVVPFIYFRF